MSDQVLKIFTWKSHERVHLKIPANTVINFTACDTFHQNRLQIKAVKTDKKRDK